MEPGTGRPFPPVDGVEISHRFVDIGGLRVHVAEAGEGTPLLMLHGWPQNWWVWRKQIPHFASYFRVIAPDMRGFGWTDAPRGGYLKERLADDVAALVGALGYDHVRLLSHDWGGWVGFLVCAKHPGMVTQHFATNVPPLWPRISLRMIPAMMRLGYMFRLATPLFGPRILTRDERFVHEFLKRGETRAGGWTEFELNAFSDQFHDQARARASAHLFRSFLLAEAIPVGLFRRYRSKQISTPTRLLFGANDSPIALSWLRGYESHFDDFLIELVPRVGHFLIDEAPDLVNERALKFFRDPKFRSPPAPPSPEKIQSVLGRRF